MNDDQKIKERETRIARSFTVRINEDMFAKNPRWDIVMTKNISASGILFNYDHYLEPGSRVRFKIALPFCGSVDCIGEVVRNVMGTSRGFNSSSPAVSAIAAVFLDINEQDQQAMRVFFNQIHADAGPADEAEPTDDPGSAPKDKSEERQRAKRISRSFMIRILKQPENIWELVTIKDISSSGLLFAASEPMDVGFELFMKVSLPFVEVPVLFRGTVVRVEEQARPGALEQVYGIGVSFSDLSETFRQQLDEFAEQAGRE